MIDDFQQERRTCPLEHRGHPDRPSYSAPGSVLCAGHIAKVDSRLLELATFARDADQAEHDAALSSSSAPPLSGSKEQPLIYSDRLAEHRKKVRGVLASWSILIADERDVAPPAAPVPRLLVEFLRRHHDWSVQQDWADDYAGEILELGRRAWSLLHPSGRRRFEVGKCAEVGCTGNVWALLTPDDPYADVASELVCDMCEVRVASDRWLTYGRKVRAA